MSRPAGAASLFYDPAPVPSRPRAVAAAAVLAIALSLSLIAPRLSRRRERDFLRVSVTATRAVPAGGDVTLHVIARNVHPARRRVFTEAIDLSSSLVSGGRPALAGAPGAEGPGIRRLPFADVWRVPFVEEIAPGEARSLAIHLADARPGRHDGWVDVVLDGSTWVRTPVAFEVAEGAPGRARSASGESR